MAYLLACIIYRVFDVDASPNPETERATTRFILDNRVERYILKWQGGGAGNKSTIGIPPRNEAVGKIFDI